MLSPMTNVLLTIILVFATAIYDVHFTAAADTNLTVQFIARPAQSPPQLEAPKDRPDAPEFSLGGHIFVVMGVKTQSGIKEEYFGFYPRGSSVAAMIKGPGMLKAEYRCTLSSDCNPKQELQTLRRLSEVESSVTVSITDAQRRQLFKTISDWNEKQYALSDQNCASFVGDVAVSLGYQAPPPALLQTPMSYLDNVLRPIVAQEEKRRQAVSAAESADKRKLDAEHAADASDQRRLDAEKAAKAADKRRDDAEKAAQAADKRREGAEKAASAAEEKKRQAEESARSYIPPGWAKCTCPFAHASMGKVVNGEVWHEPSIRCPQ